MDRRSPLPLLLALPALLGLLLQPAAAQSGPPGGAAPPGEASPAAAAAGALAATLDELSARVQLLSRGAEATSAEAAALRRELAAAEARIKELEAARAEAGAALAQLRTELAHSQAEARSLREERQAGPGPTDEGLNAALAATTTGPGVAAGGGEADRRDAAGADSSTAPPAAPEIGPSRAHQALVVAGPDESGELAKRRTGSGEEPAAGQGKEAPARADPEQPAPARPESLPAAPQGSNARPWTGAKQGGGQRVVADRRAGALRAALAAVKRRIEEAEANGTRHEATVAEPRTGLDGARAEVPPPDGRLSAAPALVAAGRGPTGGGREAGPHGAAAGAESNPAPPAPVSVTARDAPAGDGSHGARAGDAEYLVASTPVNLRARPTMSAEVLAVVEEGNVVRRLGRGGGWLRVAYTDRFAVARTGWVHGSFLRSVDAPPRGDGAPARTEG